MKKILFLILLISQAAYCDIIPDNSHFVKKCVKIINTNEFPDFYIVAYIESPTSERVDYKLIKPNYCIQIGYKFNKLTVLAVKKKYLAGKDLDSLDWLNDKNIIKANLQLYCSDGYLDNSNPINEIEEFYKIAGINDKIFVLYKYKELFRYNNGQPNSIKTFNYVSGNESVPNKRLNQDSLVEIYPDTEILNFLESLLVTIFIELTVLFILFKSKYRHFKISSKLLLFGGILMSFSTLPYIWFVLPVFIKTAIPYILASELSVIFIESFILYHLLKMEYKKMLLVSFLCNLISFAIGFGLNYVNLL